MSRVQIISQTIQSFNRLRNQLDRLFSESDSNNAGDIMVDELFESKLNPLLREITKTILSIPLNDYILVATDLWIKELNGRVGIIKKDTSNASSLALKYIPKIIDALGEVKLEILELLLSDPHLEDVNKTQYRAIDSQSPLTSEGIAMLLVQLQNFGVVKPDIPMQTIINLFAPLLGCEAREIEQHIYFDEKNRRQSAKVDTDNLDSLIKILKSIIGRIENQKYVNGSSGDEAV